MEDQHVTLKKKLNEHDKGVNASRSPKNSPILEKDFLNSIENLLDTKRVEVETRIKTSVLDEFQTNKVNLEKLMQSLTKVNRQNAP